MNQNSASTKISSVFKGYMTRSELNPSKVCDSKTKRIISEEMTSINKKITHSSSAYTANGILLNGILLNTYSYEEKSTLGQYVCYFYLEQEIKRADTKWSSNFRELMKKDAFEYEDLSQDQLTLIIKETYQNSYMVCDTFAMYLAIKLRENPEIPIHVKDQIKICKCQGHVFVCIGDPKDERNSLVVDPWIHYLFLVPTPGYRPYFLDVKSEGRKNGFLGSIQEFKKFLAAHPNIFVPAGSDLTITYLEVCTEKTKKIHSSMIENHV
jgi:hypothetical protein